MPEGLKPCPACGGKAERIALGHRIWIECKACECRGPTQSALTGKAEELWNSLPREHPTAAFLSGLSLGAALTGARAVRSAALAKATRDMRDRQRAYFKHRGDVLLAEAKAAEADVDRLLAEIFPAPKQGQLF